jgi:hypothetical protein
MQRKLFDVDIFGFLLQNIYAQIRDRSTI